MLLCKYRKFLQNLTEAHSDKIFFETVLKAFDAIFEGEVPEDVLLVDTLEADQLSKSLKTIEQRSDIKKGELNKIYNLFIRMDKNKFNEPLPKIFNKVKQKLIDLSQGTGSIEDVLNYLGMFI